MLNSTALRYDAPVFVLSRYKDELMRNGVVSFDAGEDLFTQEEWRLLERGAEHQEMPYEQVSIGDAGEPNLVEVGRLMTDVDQPRVVNARASRAMLDVLGSEERLGLYAELIGADAAHMRRAQINRMHAGSFIGRHLDQDSNPDYSVAIVLQMGSAFEGGEFVVHPPQGGTVTVRPTYRSVTISRCDFPHEVRPVHSGLRTSLVYFVAAHDGKNRRLHAAA